MSWTTALEGHGVYGHAGRSGPECPRQRMRTSASRGAQCGTGISHGQRHSQRTLHQEQRGPRPQAERRAGSSAGGRDRRCTGPHAAAGEARGARAGRGRVARRMVTKRKRCRQWRSGRAAAAGAHGAHSARLRPAAARPSDRRRRGATRSVFMAGPRCCGMRRRQRRAWHRRRRRLLGQRE
ncbi:hypothetical protein PAHAL_2G218900 [Panicum hallii]|uniref:Uncharacterized protein n=1 Tax=Panicum hallii TaxID=206008 RepID=A0A2T8KPW1_9POAL|nr:hypothetical protein PAHAL_2G218900 [Panicum hallii]